MEPLWAMLIRWQDSFERDEKPARERDIEMGNPNPKDNSDYGLKDFFEQVWSSSIYDESTSADLKVLSNILFAVL